VKKLDACTIVSFEDPLVMYRTDYLVCTKQVDQGVDFRKAIYNSWLREMTLVGPKDPDFNDFIPRIPDNNQYDVRVVLPATKD